MPVKQASSRSPKESNELLEDYSNNAVQLCGKVSGAPAEKELPSGDKVVEFRIVIGRASRDGVDTLDIAAWSSKARRSAMTLKPGQWVEIEGQIHRRFWQSPNGLASRWQVESEIITKI